MSPGQDYSRYTARTTHAVDPYGIDSAVNSVLAPTVDGNGRPGRPGYPGWRISVTGSGVPGRLR